MHEGPIAEFTALRLEIQFRADVLWKVFSLQITSTGALLAFALSHADRAPFLLILPPVTYMLASRHALHSVGIFKVGEYIKEHLSSAVPGGLHWEQWMEKQRPSLKRWEFTLLNPSILAYPGASALALISLAIWATNSKPWSIQHTAIWYAEVVAWALGILLTVLTYKVVHRPIGDRYRRRNASHLSRRYVKRRHRTVVAESFTSDRVVRRYSHMSS